MTQTDNHFLINKNNDVDPIMIIVVRKTNHKKINLDRVLFNYVLELRLLTSTNRTFQNVPNRDNVVLSKKPLSTFVETSRCIVRKSNGKLPKESIKRD